MPYEYDVQIGKVAGPIMEMQKGLSQAAEHDIETRRKGWEGLSGIFRALPFPENVKTTDFTTKTADGHQLAMRWYYNTSSSSSPKLPGPAAVYIHGGGMILGSIDDFNVPTAEYVSQSGVPMLSVDYRLAPEHPHPTPVEDAYASLVFLHDHAAEFDVDPKRIAVFGASAGGGIAAGVALLARDRNLSPPLAKQILVYPMLDDRTRASEDEEIQPYLFWTNADNASGWAALVGRNLVGTDKVSEYAAPGRARSVFGLPPTYIDVGTLDCFRDEDVEYASRLMKEHINVELHVYPGVPHAFEIFDPKADLPKLANQNRLRALKSF